MYCSGRDCSDHVRWKHLAEGFRESGARRTCPSEKNKLAYVPLPPPSSSNNSANKAQEVCLASQVVTFQMCFRLGGEVVVVRDVNPKAKRATVVVRGEGVGGYGDDHIR